ncbi:hypothetical protein N9V60_04220 [Flavobacteriaceae bacterium]|nr:hypothetical protein [Flavobacteriaceae bacterium]MDB2340667.1 hypothetical protein [Flavobacteriaceae bacterium]
MKRYIPILFSLILHSQVKIDIPDFVISSLNASENVLTLYSKDEFHEISLESFNIVTYPYNFHEILESNFSVENIKNDILFIRNGSGEVFKMGNKSVKRIDKSTIQDFLIGSDAFAFKDTIFRYGGYGYWTVFNKLIYYDYKTSQWELYKNTQSEGRFNHETFIDKDKAYFVGGFSLGTDINQNDVQKKKVEYYDFNDKAFNLLGNGTSFFHGKKIKNDLGENLLFKKNRKLLKLDFEKNNVIEYFDNSLFSKISFDYDCYFHRGNFIFISEKQNKKYLNVIPQELILSQKVAEYDLLENNNIGTLKILGLTLFVAIIFFLGYYLINLKKSLRLGQNVVYYGFNKKSINNIQYEILREIFDKGSIYSSQIDSLIFDDNLSRASNFKKKNFYLKELDQLLQLLTGLNEGVLIKKETKLDARIKMFVLNEKIKIRT